MIRFFITLIAATLLLPSCSDKAPAPKPIVMGDTTLIVTETTDEFLDNFTEDISPTSKKTTEVKITQMMEEVDSARTAQKAEVPTAATAVLKGFTINFSECTVVFDGLSAHALNASQDERTANSVAYVRDGGNLMGMSLQVNGLQEVKVEQRLFVKLAVRHGDEEYILDDLGKFITNWSMLATSNNQYTSLDQAAMDFHALTPAKLKNALDRELRKKKRSRQEIQEWMKRIEKTKSFSDEPCLLKLVAGQWRIIGKANGKRVQKLIQFDILH
jgi:hypothetical protein